MKEKISQDLIGYLEKLTQSAASFKNSQKKRGASLVEKIMYSASACSIEISTKSQEIGIIISVSNNTKHIFNVNDQDLIGSNINKIMPQKMQAEHNRLLQNWVRTCSWSNIGKIRQVFCLDTRNTCFAGRIYFKPIQRQESINLIGVFIK